MMGAVGLTLHPTALSIRVTGEAITPHSRFAERERSCGGHCRTGLRRRELSTAIAPGGRPGATVKGLVFALRPVTSQASIQVEPINVRFRRAVLKSSSRCMQVSNSSTLDSQLLHISNGYWSAARLVLAFSGARFRLYSSGTRVAYHSEGAAAKQQPFPRIVKS